MPQSNGPITLQRKRRAMAVETSAALLATAMYALATVPFAPASAATGPVAATDLPSAATPFPAVHPLPPPLRPALRVMALGDSITAGVGANGVRLDSGGYRGALAKLLTKNGYHATFVGSRSDYSAQIDAADERAHEGWPGYVLRSFPSDPGPGQLYGDLIGRAIRRDDPDLILLMAGTNDLLRLEKRRDGYTLANITHSMDLLLGEIFTEKPGVHVIVAPVVASPLVDACTLARFDGTDPCGPAGGDSLASIVARYAARGYAISLARGMASAVPRDREHFPDGIHPCGDGGYGSIAAVWYDAIAAMYARPVTESIAKP